MAKIFVGKGEGDAKVGPAKVKGRVIEAEAALGGGAVEIVTLIGEECIVFKDNEAVGKTAGDVKLEAVGSREFDGNVLAVGGGTFTDIDGNIPDGTADDADEFGLGVRGGLPVESANDALGGKTFVVLHEVGRNAGFAITGLIVGFAEVTAGVAEDFGNDDFRAFNGRVTNFRG